MLLSSSTSKAQTNTTSTTTKIMITNSFRLFGQRCGWRDQEMGPFFKHEKQPPTSYQISRLLTFSLRQTCFMFFFSFLETIIPRARSRKLGTKMGPVFGSSRRTSIWRLRIRSLQEEKAFVIKNQVMGVMGP